MANIIETPEAIRLEPYHVYARTDEQGRITAVNSSAFVSPDWGTEIDQGYGDQYHHAQGNYFPQPIYTIDGIPRYKLVDGQAVERTEEEIAADRLPLQASAARAQRDKLLAATDWTVLPDSPLDGTSQTALKTYRQALRDVPQQDGFPGTITWPEMPATANQT